MWSPRAALLLNLKGPTSKKSITGVNLRIFASLKIINFEDNHPPINLFTRSTSDETQSKYSPTECYCNSSQLHFSHSIVDFCLYILHNITLRIVFVWMCVLLFCNSNIVVICFSQKENTISIVIKCINPWRMTRDQWLIPFTDA